MARPRFSAPLAPSARLCLEKGIAAVPRIFAVEPSDEITELNPHLEGPSTLEIVTPEHRALLGAPSVVGWKCQVCAREIDGSRKCCGKDPLQVVEWSNKPTEYGPLRRAKRQIVTPDSCAECHRDFSADLRLKRCPNCQSEDIIRGGRVIESQDVVMRESEIRRAIAGQAERDRLAKMGITGGVTADRIRLLPLAR